MEMEMEMDREMDEEGWRDRDGGTEASMAGRRMGFKELCPFKARMEAAALSRALLSFVRLPSAKRSKVAAEAAGATTQRKPAGRRHPQSPIPSPPSRD